MVNAFQCWLATRKKRFAGVFLLVAFLLSAGVSGCRRQRAEIEGEVTRNGSPIYAGLIEFTPDLDRGHDGPTVAMRVDNGRFSSRHEPAGLSAGHYRVRVTVAAEKPGDGLKGEATPAVYGLSFVYPPDPPDGNVIFELENGNSQ